MRLIAHHVQRRIFPCIILLALVVIAGCQSTVTAPPAASLQLLITITFAEPIPSGTALVDAGFVGHPFVQGATLTCNQVPMHFGYGVYSATVPIPAFPGGYTFSYQAKGQRTSVTIPLLQPEIVGPAPGSRVPIPPPASPTVLIAYRIQGAIPTQGATVQLTFGATDSQGDATDATRNRLMLDHLPSMGETTLNLSRLTPSAGSVTPSTLGAGAGEITLIGSLSSTVVTIPSDFRGINLEYKFATSIPVVWTT